MAKNPPAYRSRDMRLPPATREVMGALRGDMVAAAERHVLPRRFEAAHVADRPAMLIVDTETGRRHEVGLYAYGAVRELLLALFPEREA